MSEISDIYHASSSIGASAPITRLLEAERSDADQSNTTAITSNASTSNAGFELSKTQMRKLFAKNEIIEIDFKRYIENHFRIYFDKRIYDYNLWFSITEDFEVFIINIWRLVFSDLWITIHEICCVQGFWIDLSCRTYGKRADCMHQVVQFECHEEWTLKQIEFVKKRYNRFSSAVRQRNHEIYEEREVIARKTSRIYSFNQRGRSLSSDPGNRFENQVFIGSTTTSETDSERTAKRHIEQSLGGASPADDLIGQSAEQDQKHLLAASNTISLVQDTRDQDFRLASHQATNRRSYEMNWKNRSDQKLRDVRNDSQFAWKNQLQNQRQFIFQSLPNRFQVYQRAYESIQSEISQSTQSQVNQQQILQMQQMIQSTPQSTIQSTIQSIFQSMTQSTQSSANQSASSQQSSSQASSSQLFSIQSSANQSFQKSTVLYFYELTQLDKAYKIEKKFEKTEDNLQFKLAVFRDKCRRVGLSEDAYIMTASIMLKDQALIFYYNGGQYTSWSDFIEALRKFFENFEWNRMNLIKWQIINLIDVIVNNFNFSTSECFVKLIEDMDLLQRNLRNQFAKAFYLHENIIRAIRGHSALMAGFVNSSNDVVGLINNLHFSIINYEAVHRSLAHENYVQFYNDEMKSDEAENEMFFINRRYQGHRPSYRDRDRSYMKSRNAFFRGSSRFSFQRQKKCFVCEKVGCWSTNHTQQKRNDSIKKFENQKSHFRIKFDFNRKIHQWIIEYENENENETIHFFDNLIINFETYNVDFDWLEKIESNSFNSHQFFISYESLENFESLIIIE